jgi:hypothetical protein
VPGNAALVDERTDVARATAPSARIARALLTRARARELRGYMRSHEHGGVHARGVWNACGHAAEQAARPVEPGVHDMQCDRRTERVARGERCTQKQVA